MNRMSDGGESTQQDANLEDTSAPQIESSPDSQQTDASALQVEAPVQQEKQTPFHEHPRFRELIDKNRTAEERLAQYESRMQEMERRYQEASRAQQPQKQVNPFVEELRKINPQYAEYIEGLENKASKVDNVEKSLEEMRYEKLVNQYENSVDRLHSEHKTPESIKGMIRQQLDALAVSGQVSLKNVGDRYKQLLDGYNRLLDETKRAERASYVQDKTKDASTPVSQPKGKSPTRNDKGQFTGDREADLATIARRALKISRAEGDF